MGLVLGREGEEMIPFLFSEFVDVKEKKHVDGDVGRLSGGLKKDRSSVEGGGVVGEALGERGV